MMEQRFLNFIREKRLFSSGDRILLTVSGGIDSMVMLDLFLKAGFSIGVAHCNFGLRGKESLDDEKFVKKISTRNKIKFFSVHFNTKEYAQTRKLSIQMAARELRYPWFEEVRKKNGYQAIATAHHLEDSAETCLLNLTRGTGISGLKGISPRSGYVVRPLLFATREQIRNYAEKNRIPWREDSSNLTDKYSRNLIRHKVIPVLKSINPEFMSAVSRTIERTGSAENFILKWLEEQKRSWVSKKKNTVIIQTGRIRHYREPALLYFLLKDFGYSYFQAGMILDSLGRQPGSRYYSGKYILTVDRSSLVISLVGDSGAGCWQVEKNQPRLDTGQGDWFSFSLIRRSDSIPRDPGVACLDAGRLKFPLLVRAPKSGDRFRPLGMKGTQKLSDFMINHKIPRNLKNNLRLVISDEQIAWIAGYRIDDRFKITEETKKVLQIEYFYDPGEIP